MFPRRGKTRVGTVLLAATLLGLILVAPAGAAGWIGWGEAGPGEGVVPRVLAWLGFGLQPVVVMKCDDGSLIDPNGCPKMQSESGLPALPGARRGEIPDRAWRPVT
jgi:hypothetical protein